LASPINEFGSIAHKLARNPLGIIALFIVLVYAIAALVTGTGNLSPEDRRPLIYFLVAFPPLVLWVFYRLVTGHHTKLYAPQDFQDKDGFFRALTPEEQKRKLEAAVKELVLSLPANEATSNSLDSSPSAVEISRTTPFRVRGREASFRKYYLAESLAMRELEAEFGSPIKREVAAGGLELDGLFMRKGRPTVVEVKMVTTQSWQRALNSAERRLHRLKTAIKPEPSFVFVAVSDGVPDEIPPATSIQEKLRNGGLDVQVRHFELAQLESKYGVTGDDGPPAG
jgi:hypothetical protein